MDSSTTRSNKLLLELSQRFNQVSNAESSELIKKTNRAAVLICLFEEQDDVYVILTKRSSKLSSYSGEVSLPGGRMDEDDTDDIQTALREAKEEIGLDPALVDVVTVLEPFVTKRNVTVVPVIGILWNKQSFSPAPNAEEVESIFYAPFEMFLKMIFAKCLHFETHTEKGEGEVGPTHVLGQPTPLQFIVLKWDVADENRRQEEREFQGDKYLLHYFDHVTDNKEYIIWALTAGILITAASLVYQRPPDFHFRMPKFWNRNYSKF